MAKQISRFSDAVGVCSIIAAVLFATHRVWLDRSALSYLDNPAHLAEAFALRESRTGWIDIAFGGFDLHRLHSPFWYGALALAPSVGASIESTYALFVVAGCIAPPIAMYWIARPRVGICAGVLYALTLLFNSVGAMGTMSAVGGMWTFGICFALWMVLARVLSGSGSGLKRATAIATLVGFIGVTHSFGIVATALLGAVHVLASFAGGGSRSRTLKDIGGFVAGALASAVYWLPVLLARQTADLSPRNRPASFVISALFGVDLAHPSIAEISRPDFVISGVHAALLATGTVAAAGLWRQRTDLLPTYGRLSALILLIVLLIFLPDTERTWLGPLSVRFVFFAKAGLLFSSLPLVDSIRVWLRRWVGARPYWAAAPALALLMALIGGKSMRSRNVNPTDVQELKGLWAFLRNNRSEQWGRVYLQDTIIPRHPFHDGHVLALTTHETGVAQLGSYYGLQFRSHHWPLSEGGRLFNRHGLSPEMAAEEMRSSNCTHLVLTDSHSRNIFDTSLIFAKIYNSLNYAVYALLGASSSWVKPVSGVDTWRIEAQRPGEWELRTSGTERGNFVLRVAYDPFWRLYAPAGARLEREGPWLQVRDLPAGEHTVKLKFRPTIWPKVISFATAIAIAVSIVFCALGARRQRATRAS